MERAKEAPKRARRQQGWKQIIQPVPGEEKGSQYRVQLRDDTFFIFVDTVEVTPNGDLIGRRGDKIQYAFGAGSWLFCLPVSVIDGSEIVASWYSRWLDS